MNTAEILATGCIVCADPYLGMIVHWDGDRTFKIYKERDNDVWTQVAGAYHREGNLTDEQSCLLARGYLDEILLGAFEAEAA